MEQKSNSKIRIIIIIIVAVVVATVIGFIAYSSGEPARKLKAKLELGQKYLNALEYEQAVATFKEALDMNPDSGEAKESLAYAYIGWADQLANDGNVDRAIEVLAEGYEILKDQRILDKKNELVQMRIASQKAEEDMASDEFEKKFKSLYDAIIEAAQVEVLGRSYADWDYEAFTSYIVSNGTPTSAGNDMVDYALTDDLSAYIASGEENALVNYFSDKTYFQMQGNWHRILYHHEDVISSVSPVLGMKIEDYLAGFGISMEDVSEVLQMDKSSIGKGDWRVTIDYYEADDRYMITALNRGRVYTFGIESGIVRWLQMETIRN